MRQSPNTLLTTTAILEFSGTAADSEYCSEWRFLDNSFTGIIETISGRFKRIRSEETDPAYRALMKKVLREPAEESEFTSFKKLRRAKGFSQARLAEIIGTTQPHIAKIEARKLALSGETIKKLADALHVAMETVYRLTAKKETE